MRAKDHYKKSGPPIAPEDEQEDGGPGAKQTVLRTAVWPSAGKAPGAPSVFAFGAAAAPAPKAVERRGGKRVRLPPLDMKLVAIRAGVPKPTPSPPGYRSRYQEVFDKLTAVGMSAAAPVEYIGGLKTVAYKLNKEGKARFSVHRLNETTCGVWRDK